MLKITCKGDSRTGRRKQTSVFPSLLHLSFLSASKDQCDVTARAIIIQASEPYANTFCGIICILHYLIMCTALEEEKALWKSIQGTEEGKFVLMLVVLFPTTQLGVCLFCFVFILFFQPIWTLWCILFFFFLAIFRFVVVLCSWKLIKVQKIGQEIMSSAAPEKQSNWWSADLPWQTAPCV